MLKKLQLGVEKPYFLQQIYNIRETTYSFQINKD